jgi:hypothetical protein
MLVPWIAVGTLTSGIAVNALALYVCNNFGRLAREHMVQVAQVKLVGPLGDAWASLSLVCVGLIGMSLALQATPRPTSAWRHRWWILLTYLVLLASASLSLYVTENYAIASGLKSDPAVPAEGQNYKLRGDTGTAVVTLAGVSIALAATSLLVLFSKLPKRGLIPTSPSF